MRDIIRQILKEETQETNPLKSYFYKRWDKQKRMGKTPNIFDISKLGLSRKKNEIIQYFVEYMGYIDQNSRSSAIKQYLLNHTFTENEITEMKEYFDDGKIKIKFNKVEFSENDNEVKNYIDLVVDFVVLSGSFYNTEENETYHFSSNENPFDDFVTYFEFKDTVENVVRGFVNEVIEGFGFNINNDFDDIIVKW
jgi:hypothetical protein